MKFPWLTIAATLVGALAGYAYYVYWGCSSG
jgi:hypothetical protein